MFYPATNLSICGYNTEIPVDQVSISERPLGTTDATGFITTLIITIAITIARLVLMCEIG